MSNYCILRTKKLSSIGSIAGSGSHNFRERPTANADPNRTSLNQTVGAKSVDDLVEAVKGRFPAKVRKNAVLAIEYLITASPEAMQKMSPKEQGSYFTDALKWLKAKHGAENVVCATVHRDETTPHLCAYVVPLHEGRLNARHYLGGRKVLSDMQTDFHAVVGASRGLSRGVEGSTADHVSIKNWYAENAKAVAALPVFDAKRIPATNNVIVPKDSLDVLVSLARNTSLTAQKIKKAELDKKEAEKQADLKIVSAKEEIAKAQLTNLKLPKLIGEKVSLQTEIKRLKEDSVMQLKNFTEEKQEIIRITAQLLKAQPSSDMAKLMQIELTGKQDIFDALVKSGRAESFADAVIQVAKAYNEANETRISEAANFVADYARQEKKQSKSKDKFDI